MIGVMADQHLGKPWVVEGSLWKCGKRVRHIKKTVTIGSEEELEKAEKEIRDNLYEQATKAYDKTGMTDVKIEVQSEVEKSVGP